MEKIMSTSEGAKHLEDLVKQIDISSQKVEDIQKKILEEHEHIRKVRNNPYQDKNSEIEDVIIKERNRIRKVKLIT